MQGTTTTLNQQKKSTASQTVVLGVVNGSQLVQANFDRVALIISSDASTAFQISYHLPAASTLGLLIPAASPALKLNLSDHGALVFGPWFVTSAAPPASITYFESLNTAP